MFSSKKQCNNSSLKNLFTILLLLSIFFSISGNIKLTIENNSLKQKNKTSLIRQESLVLTNTDLHIKYIDETIKNSNNKMKIIALEEQLIIYKKSLVKLATTLEKQLTINSIKTPNTKKTKKEPKIPWDGYFVSVESMINYYAKSIKLDNETYCKLVIQEEVRDILKEYPAINLVGYEHMKNLEKAIQGVIQKNIPEQYFKKIKMSKAKNTITINF